MVCVGAAAESRLYARAESRVWGAEQRRDSGHKTVDWGCSGDSASAIHPLQRIPFQVVFGKAYDDKTVQEELIKSSDLDWTIVRPGVLTNKKICKNYRVRMTPSEWRNGIISRSAVADYIASSIEDPVSFRTEPVLTN